VDSVMAAVILTLDYPPAEKVNLTNYLVQYGIDLYGCVQAGYGWAAFGGQATPARRNLPTSLAGSNRHLLSPKRMISGTE